VSRAAADEDNDRQCCSSS